MEIRSEDREAYVRLQLQGSVARDHPQLTLGVQMSARGFGGRHDQVGVFVTELERFVAEMDRFDRRRSGRVTLSSMSPGEFTLTFDVVDRAGHIRVTADLRRHTYVAGQLADLAVSVAFELDPSLLPAIVEDFRASLAPS